MIRPDQGRILRLRCHGGPRRSTADPHLPHHHSRSEHEEGQGPSFCSLVTTHGEMVRGRVTAELHGGRSAGGVKPRGRTLDRVPKSRRVT